MKDKGFILDFDVFIKIFLLLFFTVEGWVFYLILFEKYRYLLGLVVLVGATLIVLRPQYGLFFSTILAYSGIATKQLQGLFLPMVLLTVFAWTVKFLQTKQDSLTEAAQNKLFILLGALMVLSTFYAADLDSSLKDMYIFLKYLIFYFLMINILDSWKSVRSFLWVLTITGSFMFLYGVYSHFFSGNDVTSFRLISFVDDPNSFAIKLVPLVAFSYILLKSEDSMILKIASFIFFLSIVTAIILTFSRGGMLALFTVLLLIFIREFKGKRNILIMGFVTLLIFLIIPKELFFFRIKSISELSMDVSIIQRLKILKGGVQMFIDHPFFGVGVGNFVTSIKNYSSIIVPLVAHNSYLHIAAELGILGLAVFLSLFFVTLKSLKVSWRRLRNSQYYFYPVGILFALFGFMVHSLFLSEQYNIAFFIIVALTVLVEKLRPSLDH